MEDQIQPEPPVTGASALGEVAHEIVQNAFNLKGADFANYIGSCVDMAQLGDILHRLADPVKREGRERGLLAMGLGLLINLDRGIYTDLSMEDRMEAGALANQILQRADKLRKEASSE